MGGGGGPLAGLGRFRRQLPLARIDPRRAHDERLGHVGEGLALLGREAGAQGLVAGAADRHDAIEQRLPGRAQGELGAQAGALDQAHRFQRLDRAADLRLFMAGERDQRVGREAARAADHGDELAIERIEIGNAAIFDGRALAYDTQECDQPRAHQAQMHRLVTFNVNRDRFRIRQVALPYVLLFVSPVPAARKATW